MQVRFFESIQYADHNVLVRLFVLISPLISTAWRALRGRLLPLRHDSSPKHRHAGPLCRQRSCR
jgi:hypothetical protein